MTAPAAFPFCYPCLRCCCRHKRNACDGAVPAVTAYSGTALCGDCAVNGWWERGRLISEMDVRRDRTPR